jgi:pimeloyl-ACP methyl ester carboxylesterase
MDILLIAGLWLDASVWGDVAAHLDARGHRAVPITLPGQGDGNTSATLADQVAAVIAAVDAAAGRPMVVGHSAACTLAWLAADARPGKISKVAMVGGFPSADGAAYFGSSFPTQDGAMPFPGWGEFDGPDSVDLDDAAKQAFSSAAIPVPEGVTRGVIALADEHRYDVPVVVVCPEFTPDQAREWIGQGVPELAKSKNLSFANIDSGHWPMISAPGEFARLLAHAAEES